jgi:hypothetical protein
VRDHVIDDVARERVGFNAGGKRPDGGVGHGGLREHSGDTLLGVWRGSIDELRRARDGHSLLEVASEKVSLHGGGGALARGCIGRGEEGARERHRGVVVICGEEERGAGDEGALGCSKSGICHLKDVLKVAAGDAADAVANDGLIELRRAGVTRKDGKASTCDVRKAKVLARVALMGGELLEAEVKHLIVFGLEGGRGRTEGHLIAT